MKRGREKWRTNEKSRDKFDSLRKVREKSLEKSKVKLIFRVHSCYIWFIVVIYVQSGYIWFYMVCSGHIRFIVVISRG